MADRRLISIVTPTGHDGNTPILVREETKWGRMFEGYGE